MILYTIYDSVSGTYSFPQVSANAATADRDFQRLLKRPEIPARDLFLKQVGLWDPDTGLITVDPQGPRTLSKGSDYVKE